MKNRIRFFAGLCIAYMLLACQPVIAIGWREGLFIFALIAILIGPPVYRFIRKIEELRKHKRIDRDRRT